MSRKFSPLLIAMGLLVVGTSTSTVNATGNEGALDVGFGSNGIVAHGVPPSPLEGMLGAVQSDGKIVVAGKRNNDLALVRFEANGDLDGAFGAGGLVTLDILTEPDTPVGLQVLADDSILVASKSGGYFAVAKFGANGAADATFGTAVDDCAEAGVACVNPTASFDQATAMTVQPDGKIIVVGYNGFWPDHDIVVARFTSSGILDTGFGDKVPATVGVTVSDLGSMDAPWTVAVQPDGKILVGGYSWYSAVVLRYDTNGVSDATFGTGGVATIGELGGVSDVRKITLQETGRIIVGGRRYAGDTDFFVARLTSGGLLDHTFGDGVGDDNDPLGVEIPGSRFGNSDFLFDVEIQRDGKIVAAGYSNIGAVGRAVAARFTADGSVDSSFNGTGSIVVSSPSIGSSYLQAKDVVIAPDNDVILAGVNFNSTEFQIGLLRLNVTLHESSLSSLGSSTGNLGFTPGSTSYSADVANSVTAVNLTPTTRDRNATITVKGQVATSGKAASVTLAPGANVIPVVVTAQDGTTTTTYTVTVNRATASLRKNRVMTARAALASVDKTIPRGGRVSMRSLTTRFCRATGTSIKGLKVGTCRVRLSVTPRKTRANPRPRAVVSVVTIRIVA